MEELGQITVPFDDADRLYTVGKNVVQKQSQIKEALFQIALFAKPIAIKSIEDNAAQSLHKGLLQYVFLTNHIHQLPTHLPANKGRQNFLVRQHELQQTLLVAAFCFRKQPFKLLICDIHPE
jgi:hypothetical protein